MRRLPSWVVWLIAGLSQLALYLCFTANAGWREWMAGTAAAAVSTFAAVLFARKAKILIHFRWRDVAQMWRIPGYVVTDTAKVINGLGMQLFTTHGAPSVLTAVRFDVGGNDPVSVGRRALAISYPTSTPNSVVLGIFEKQQLLLFHQLVPDRVSPMLKNLGARP